MPIPQHLQDQRLAGPSGSMLQWDPNNDCWSLDTVPVSDLFAEIWIREFHPRSIGAHVPVATVEERLLESQDPGVHFLAGQYITELAVAHLAASASTRPWRPRIRFRYALRYRMLLMYGLDAKARSVAINLKNGFNSAIEGLASGLTQGIEAYEKGS